VVRGWIIHAGSHANALRIPVERRRDVLGCANTLDIKEVSSSIRSADQPIGLCRPAALSL